MTGDLVAGAGMAYTREVGGMEAATCPLGMAGIRDSPSADADQICLEVQVETILHVVLLIASCLSQRVCILTSHP